MRNTILLAQMDSMTIFHDPGWCQRRRRFLYQKCPKDTLKVGRKDWRAGGCRADRADTVRSLRMQTPATKRECKDKANNPPPDCTPNPSNLREFSSISLPPRAPHRRSMTSTTGSIKKTPAAMTSTANPASPSAHKGTDSANASPSAPLLLRAAAGPELGRSLDQRLSSLVSSTLAAPPPHMRHCAHL